MLIMMYQLLSIHGTYVATGAIPLKYGTPVPALIFQLILFRLGLNNNRLTTLPNEVVNLTALRYLNLKSNALKEFPAIVSNFQRYLLGYLTSNPRSSILYI